MYKIYFFLILCVSCGPSHHLRRADYHIRMAKAKGAEIKTDTIYKTVPIFTETKVYDTVVKSERYYDTIKIDNIKWSVRLKYDTVMKTQFVTVECKGDTIYKEVPVSVPVTITPKRNNAPWFIIIIVILSIFLFLEIYKVNGKRNIS